MMAREKKERCVVCNARMIARHLKTSTTGQTVCRADYQCTKRRSNRPPTPDRSAFAERIESLEKLIYDVSAKAAILRKKVRILANEIRVAKQSESP